MLENEKKIPVTRGEFMYLWHIMAENANPQIQTNFYYDTDDLSMNTNDITCRIREINGKYTATIKTHNYGGADCSMEISSVVQDELDDSFFSDMGVKLCGSLITERIFLRRQSDFEVVIDRNIYLGMTDYEIEIEYSPEMEDCAEKMISYLSNVLSCVHEDFDSREFCERQRRAKSKSARFFDKLKEQREIGCLINRS